MYFVFNLNTMEWHWNGLLCADVPLRNCSLTHSHSAFPRSLCPCIITQWVVSSVTDATSIHDACPHLASRPAVTAAAAAATAARGVGQLRILGGQNPPNLSLGTWILTSRSLPSQNKKYTSYSMCRSAQVWHALCRDFFSFTCTSARLSTNGMNHASVLRGMVHMRETTIYYYHA